MVRKLSLKQIKIGQELVKKARKNKYSVFLKENKDDLKKFKEALDGEVRLDLEKSCDIDEEEIKPEKIEVIVSELLEKGGSDKLNPSKNIHLIKGFDKQDSDIFIEDSREKRGCCAGRRQFVYEKPFFEGKGFVEKRDLLIEMLGETTATDYYYRGVGAAHHNKCGHCSYFLKRLLEYGEDGAIDFESDESKERNIPPIRINKIGITIKATSEPNMVCCRTKIKKQEQLLLLEELVDAKDKNARLKGFERSIEIRNEIKDIYLLYKDLKQPICQSCFDFLEDLSAMIKIEIKRNDLNEQK